MFKNAHFYSFDSEDISPWHYQAAQRHRAAKKVRLQSELWSAVVCQHWVWPHLSGIFKLRVSSL